jgi:transcriptional regulator with XRE-family HTH domain
MPITRPDRPVMQRYWGWRIRTRRQQLGLSETQLAAQVGVGQWQVSRIESGERAPTIWQLFDLARALNTSIDALLGAGAHDPAAQLDGEQAS